MIEPLIPALGWALLNFVWQGLLLGGAAVLLLWSLRRADPRWRYAVCGLALLACLLLPLVHLLWLLTQDPGELTELVELPDWLLQMQELLPALVNGWACGVGLMGVRLGLGLAWVARLRHQAAPASVVWQARLDALAHRLGLRRSIPLRLFDGIGSPLTVGFWRPVVLLPAALLSRLPVPMLEALLAHELAHVRRWDYLFNLLQSLVEALLFFHPVVWWLSSRMRDEREQVADAIAAQSLGDSRRVAQALAELSCLDEALPPTANLALSARGGRLLQRIERLMTPQPHATGWKLALPALALACASVLVQAQNQKASGQVQPAPVASPAPAAAAHPAALAKPADAATPTGVMRLPVNARHALVLDDDSGKVLMAKDADAVVPIASLTKLMTAMVVLDAKQDPNEKLRIVREDVDTLKHSLSRVPVGAEMTRQAALSLALMASENRAASALARSFPGGSNAFVLAMQAKARSLGLTRTTLVEPTGLSPSNVSTASEVARIMAAAARYPEIARITADDKTRVPVNGKAREVRNTNRLVGAKGWDIRLSKTGYTEEAGRCLAMRMKSAGKDVTVVLLDADGSAQRLRDAAAIRKQLAKHG
ncbi:M56 family metallopeptidase [Pelomonas sp. SE-A7]|uniref:M56 family metallopeptidase n=1 Tax=Pelomonas sp. SE-A7 TaxID=3054953 RepID=UPI00259CF71D|nr:M56 family metallopeptidase [Pelomonas sp. SE-A7]MDM4765820.1 M56 family metallopeptidase [Pelomonas sp. SE-A7]